MSSKSRTRRERLVVAYGSQCWYCYRSLNDDQMTVDHWWPKKLGGSNDLDNLRPACVECNSAKGSKAPLEFSAPYYGSKPVKTRPDVNTSTPAKQTPVERWTNRQLAASQIPPLSPHGAFPESTRPKRLGQSLKYSFLKTIEEDGSLRVVEQRSLSTLGRVADLRTHPHLIRIHATPRRTVAIVGDGEWWALVDSSRYGVRRASVTVAAVTAASSDEAFRCVVRGASESARNRPGHISWTDFGRWSTPAPVIASSESGSAISVRPPE